MCSPELTRGLCCICFGQLTPENTFYDGVAFWDFHKGKCALLSGETAEVDEVAALRLDGLVKRVHAATSNSPEHRAAIRDYYRYVDSIATEDHYDPT